MQKGRFDDNEEKRIACSLVTFIATAQSEKISSSFLKVFMCNTMSPCIGYQVISMILKMEGTNKSKVILSLCYMARCLPVTSSVPVPSIALMVSSTHLYPQPMSWK
jgi:hypothetical protein